jgi:hypothetical protein
MQAGSNNARGNKADGFIELDSIDKPRIAGSEAPNDRRGPKSIEYSNDEQRMGSVAPASPAYRAEKFKDEISRQRAQKQIMAQINEH